MAIAANRVYRYSYPTVACGSFLSYERRSENPRINFLGFLVFGIIKAEWGEDSVR